MQIDWLYLYQFTFMVHSQVLTNGLAQFSCKHLKIFLNVGSNKMPFHKLQKDSSQEN